MWRLGDGGGGGGEDNGGGEAAPAAADDDPPATPARSSGVVRVLAKPQQTTSTSAAAPPAEALPFTCLDWCGASGGRRLVASSLDGTASVWDVETGGAPIAWVRAHPGGAAHGCCWSGGGGGGGGGGSGGASSLLPASPDVFATCGGGGGSGGCGSVRIFDLRDGCKRAAVLFELPADGCGGVEAEEEEEDGEEEKAAAAARGGAAEGAAVAAAGEEDEDDGSFASEEEDGDDEEEEDEQEAAAAAAAAAAPDDDNKPPPAERRKRRRRRRLNPQPSIVRVAWSAADPRYLACVPQNSPSTLVLDIRFPSAPLAVLCRHRAAVNALAWSPADAAALVTAGDDAQALIWDLSGAAGVVGGGGGGADGGGGGGGAGVDPILTWVGDSEVAALQWSNLQPDWIALAVGRRAQIMLV